MVKLDLKGSIDHGFGQGAFLVAPLGGIWVRPAHLPLNPPPGLPAIVHHLLGLAKMCAALGLPEVVAAQLVCTRPCRWCAHPLRRVSMVGG